MAFTNLNCVAGEVLTATKMNLYAENDKYLKEQIERVDSDQKTTAGTVSAIETDIDDASKVLDEILGENTAESESGDSGNTTAENPENPDPTTGDVDKGEDVNG